MDLKRRLNHKKGKHIAKMTRDINHLQKKDIQFMNTKKMLLILRIILKIMV